MSRLRNHRSAFTDDPAFIARLETEWTAVALYRVCLLSTCEGGLV